MNFYNYALANPINGIDPSGLATLHYWGARLWGPWIQRYGHVSLTLNDGTYISFYPTKFNLLNPNGPIDPIFSGTVAEDGLNENGAPDVEIKLNNLDEAAIKAWWDNYRKTNPKFRGFSNNCSTIVSHAFDVGGGRNHVPEFGISLLFWTPGTALDYARGLQKAGEGVYNPQIQFNPHIPPSSYK